MSRCAGQGGQLCWGRLASRFRVSCEFGFELEDLELMVWALGLFGFPCGRFGQDTNDWYKNWDAAAARLFVGNDQIQAVPV